MSVPSKYADAALGPRARTLAPTPLAPGALLGLYALGCLLCLLLLTASTLLPASVGQPLQLISCTGIAVNLMIGLAWVRQLFT